MSMFHDLNISKSLMDTVKGVQEGKSKEEIESIQKKYQSESKKLNERELTDAEKKKREEIAKAIERDNPGMDKQKKMAIATDKAKEATESVNEVDQFKSGDRVYYKKDDLPRQVKKQSGENTMIYLDGKWQWVKTSDLSKVESVEEQTKTKKNTKDDVKGKGKVDTEPTDDNEKKGKKEPVDINPKMDEAKNEKDDPCWDDYKQVGMKKKDGEKVPNCVPEEDYKPSYGVSLESVIKQVHKRHK